MLSKIQRFQLFKSIIDQLKKPHSNLPPVIHVAGTNGKGSTIAFLRAILEAAGFGVHTFTSPHLIKVSERFMCNSQPLTTEEYNHCYDLTASYYHDFNLSYFEHHTLMAYLLFTTIPADFCLIEVGIGGTYDPTNFIQQPLASVITTIDYDHTNILGSQITDIATAKAGIIKSNCPVFTSVHNPQILQILKETCKEKNAKLYHMNREFSYMNTTAGWKFEIKDQNYKFNLPQNLMGGHQLENAALAAATLLTVLPNNIYPSTIEQGIHQAKWPGRLEKFYYQNKVIWFDGAHNPQGAFILNKYFNEQAQKLHIIVAQQLDKDIINFINMLNDITLSLNVIPLEDQNKFNQVVVNILQHNHSNDILITGSLYLYKLLINFLDNNCKEYY